MSRAILGTLAVAFGLIGCGSRTPVSPSTQPVPPTWRTFAIDGQVTESIGLPVPSGSRVTGRVQPRLGRSGGVRPGDPSLPRTGSSDSVRYPGVAVTLTVGSDSISGNGRSASTIQILFAVPTFDVFRDIVGLKAEIVRDV